VKEDLYIKFSDCQVDKKNKAKSANFLVDMFEEAAGLCTWQSESNVLKKLVTQSERERERTFVGTGIVETSGMCGRKYSEIRIWV